MVTTICTLKKSLIPQCFKRCERYALHRGLTLYLPHRDGPGIMTVPGVMAIQSLLIKGSPSHTVQRCPNTGPVIPGGLVKPVPVTILRTRWIPHMKTNIINHRRE